jgi:hypothetical protein
VLLNIKQTHERKTLNKNKKIQKRGFNVLLVPAASCPEDEAGSLPPMSN